MASENETLADIVAEMRKMKRYAKSESNDCRYVAYWCYQTFADRIEAAARRETGAAWNRGYYHAKRDFRPLADELARRQPVDNTAAMHKALETIHDKVNGLDEECGVDPVEIRDLARAALAKPPRNCDLPLVVDGPADNNADKAWLVFKRHNPNAYFDVSGLLRCIDWLLAPAAERKGEGDGR